MHFEIPWKTCSANKAVSVSKWSQTSRPANFEGHISHNCILYVWIENATSLKTDSRNRKEPYSDLFTKRKKPYSMSLEIRTKYLLSHWVRLFYFVCNKKERNRNLASQYLHKNPCPFAVKGAFISPISSESQWLPATFVVRQKISFSCRLTNIINKRQKVSRKINTIFRLMI